MDGPGHTSQSSAGASSDSRGGGVERLLRHLALRRKARFAGSAEGPFAPPPLARPSPDGQFCRHTAGATERGVVDPCVLPSLPGQGAKFNLELTRLLPPCIVVSSAILDYEQCVLFSSSVFGAFWGMAPRRLHSLAYTGACLPPLRCDGPILRERFFVVISPFLSTILPWLTKLSSHWRPLNFSRATSTRTLHSSRTLPSLRPKTIPRNPRPAPMN